MPSRKHWLDVSARMFERLLPPGAPGGDAPQDHDGTRVDDALVEMALARGPEHLPALVAQLEPGTLAALRQRWQRHVAAWEANPEPFPWIPPKKPDVWRAVLIAMIEAEPRARQARSALWSR